jgi:hypothetical protein
MGNNPEVVPAVAHSRYPLCCCAWGVQVLARCDGFVYLLER